MSRRDDGETNRAPSRSVDPTVEAIAALAREERHREPSPEDRARLERLARGELSSEEEARLVAELPHTVVSLYRPLGPAMEDRLEEIARAGLALPARERASTPGPALPIVSGGRPRRLPLGWALAPLAAAAAVTLWVLRPTPPPPPLASYTLQISGGESGVRADAAAAGPPVVGPGSRLSFELRPATPVPVPVQVAAWVSRDGRPQPWAVVPEIAASGAVRLAGTYESLGLGSLAPGEWEALIAIAPSGSLPDAAQIEAAVGAPPPSDAPWRLQRGRFLVRPAR